MIPKPTLERLRPGFSCAVILLCLAIAATADSSAKTGLFGFFALLGVWGLVDQLRSGDGG
jgi:hypothetical protein